MNDGLPCSDDTVAGLADDKRGENRPPADVVYIYGDDPRRGPAAQLTHQVNRLVSWAVLLGHLPASSGSASTPWLAWLLECSERQVWRAIAEARRSGLLVRQARYDERVYLRRGKTVDGGIYRAVLVPTAIARREYARDQGAQ